MDEEGQEFLKNVKFSDYKEFKKQVMQTFSHLPEKQQKMKLLELWKHYKDKKKIDQQNKIEEHQSELINTLKRPKKSSSSNLGISINKQTFIKVLQQGSINQDYLMYKKQQLGSGQFGVTYKVPLKSDPSQYRAIKVMLKSEVSQNLTNVRQFFEEINNLMQLDHANIVRLYAVYEDDINYYLVMEICQGGEVFDRIAEEKQFNEDKAREIFIQIVQGINYCHKNNVRHGDLKAENLMFLNQNSNTIKIIDFGFSLKSQDQCNFSGSAYYRSPELLLNQTDLLADIYAMGITLYIMVTGKPPQKMIIKRGPNGEITKEIVHSICFQSKNGVTYSEEVQDLIHKCLKPSKQRLTAEQILQHPWISKYLEKQQILEKQQSENSNGNLDKSLNLLDLQQFKEYTKSLHLRKLILTHLAINMEETDILNLQQCFKSLDTNHDGMISYEELKQGLQQNQSQLQNISNLEGIFKEIDTDGSGNIDYTEFLAATIQKNIQLQDNKLRVIFDLIDTNKDGVLQKQEIIDYIKYHTECDNDNSIQQEDKNNQNNNNINSIDYDKIMSKIDLNGDGEIDFEEFKQLIHGDAQQYFNSQIQQQFSQDNSQENFKNSNENLEQQEQQENQQKENQNLTKSQNLLYQGINNWLLKQIQPDNLLQYFSEDKAISELIANSQQSLDKQ